MKRSWRRATPRTQALMHKLQGLMKLEQEFGGVLDVDTQTVSSLLNYKPGYLDKDNELIVGLQTDRPLKRGVNPFGGIRMAREACRAYGYELSGQVEQEFATAPPTTTAYSACTTSRPVRPGTAA